MNTEELKLFNSANWNEISKILIRYAEMKCFRKSIRSVSELPEGKEPPDIALVAIQKTLEWICTGIEGPGSRKWNRALNPELLDHLKDVVDSEVSNLILKKEHLSTNYSSKTDGETAVRIFEETVDAIAPQTPTPEDTLDAKFEIINDEDLIDTYLVEIHELLEKKNDEEATLVLMSFEEQSKGDGVPKHHVAAEQTGLAIESVRNAVKRIKNAALAVKESVKRRLEHGQ